MKKTYVRLVVIMVLTFLMVSNNSNIVMASTSKPKQIDSYTEIYDIGDGNFRLILQTDTSKNIGNGRFVFSNIKLNSNIIVDDVSAGKDPSDEANISATYDEDTHSVNWKIDYFFDLDQMTFPPIFPVNYLIIDFHVNDDVFGDILIFEKVNYNIEFEGYDGPLTSTFDFWQVAVRVEAPVQDVSITHEYFADKELVTPIEVLHSLPNTAFVKFTIKNPNSNRIKNAEFSSSFDIKELKGTTELGSVIDVNKLNKNDTVIIDIDENETVVLIGQLNLGKENFVNVDDGNIFTLTSKVSTPNHSLFEIDMAEENILGSGHYVQLKSIDEMQDHLFQSAFIEDEMYGWQEGMPFKTEFDYDVSFPETSTTIKSIPATYSASLKYKEVLYSNILVNYVDQNENKLSDSIVLRGIVGNNYETNQLDISGYHLVETRGNPKGTFEEHTGTITYIYKKVDNIKPVKPDNLDIPNSKLPSTGIDSPTLALATATLLTGGLFMVIGRRTKKF